MRLLLALACGVQLAGARTPSAAAGVVQSEPPENPAADYSGASASGASIGATGTAAGGAAALGQLINARAKNFGDRRAIVLTFFNAEYASLANNLLCSLTHAGLSEHTVATADCTKTCTTLLSPFRDSCAPGLDNDGDALGQADVGGARGTVTLADYGSSQFRVLAQLKPRMVRIALDLGVDALFIDADVVVLRDVLSPLMARLVYDLQVPVHLCGPYGAPEAPYDVPSFGASEP